MAANNGEWEIVQGNAKCTGKLELTQKKPGMVRKMVERKRVLRKAFRKLISRYVFYVITIAKKMAVCRICC